ncbi:MAG: hypothetical protein OEZ39_00055 [Gammaproteobacteria bacterium]|nr:hypothetical protein [Gammaproteobacteria bacterium]MDH5650239.1 hypothetical protein [Gammaproteobacteria bacterium]
MFKEKIHNLVNAKTAQAEQAALSELVRTARENQIDYGYRVYNLTRNRPTQPAQLSAEMEDVLQVIILSGKEPPFQEFIQRPKDNTHISFLIMP